MLRSLPNTLQYCSKKERLHTHYSWPFCTVVLLMWSTELPPTIFLPFTFYRSTIYFPYHCHWIMIVYIRWPCKIAIWISWNELTNHMDRIWTNIYFVWALAIWWLISPNPPWKGGGRGFDIWNWFAVGEAGWMVHSIRICYFWRLWSSYLSTCLGIVPKRSIKTNGRKVKVDTNILARTRISIWRIFFLL